jgi:hypothetical protein
VTAPTAAGRPAVGHEGGSRAPSDGIVLVDGRHAETREAENAVGQGGRRIAEHQVDAISGVEVALEGAPESVGIRSEVAARGLFLASTARRPRREAA